MAAKGSYYDDIIVALRNVTITPDREHIYNSIFICHGADELEWVVACLEEKCENNGGYKDDKYGGSESKTQYCKVTL